MSSELYFRLGKIHGLNRGWYEDGTIGFEYSYKNGKEDGKWIEWYSCLLYTSPSPRDKRQSRMPSSA